MVHGPEKAVFSGGQEMVKAKKRGRGGGRGVRPGRGAGSGSADSYRRQLTRVIAKLGDEELLRLVAGAQPGFVKPGPPAPLKDDGGDTHPPVPFSTFADYIETLDSMIVDGGFYDVESCDASDLGTFIHNVGTAAERAEALLALMPVATRVFLRYDAANDARREAMHAASDKHRADAVSAIVKRKEAQRAAAEESNELFVAAVKGKKK